MDRPGAIPGEGERPTDLAEVPESPPVDDRQRRLTEQRNRVSWAVREGRLDWALHRMEQWLR